MRIILIIVFQTLKETRTLFPFTVTQRFRGEIGLMKMVSALSSGGYVVNGGQQGQQAVDGQINLFFTSLRSNV
jgi:hypothetical protein